MVYYCKITPDGDGFMVEFPDMPNVLTHGDTVDEALKNAHEAINGVLESEVTHGYTLQESKIGPGDGLHAIEVEPHIDIALQLRSLRGNAPQKAVAAKLGLSYQAYQRLENPRKGNPTIKTLERLARAHGKRLQVTIN